VIGRLLYDVARLLGGCGEIRFQQVFIDGTMLEAQANRHTAAVWRKNIDRYEEG
jgi:transposase